MITGGETRKQRNNSSRGRGYSTTALLPERSLSTATYLGSTIGVYIMKIKTMAQYVRAYGLKGAWQLWTRKQHNFMLHPMVHFWLCKRASDLGVSEACVVEMIVKEMDGGSYINPEFAPGVPVRSQK